MYSIQFNSIVLFSFTLRINSKRQKLGKQDAIDLNSEDGAQGVNQDIHVDDIALQVVDGQSGEYLSKLDILTEQDDFDDAEYTEDVTPLVLAAQLERSDMIKILIAEWPDIHPISSKYI